MRPQTRRPPGTGLGCAIAGAPLSRERWISLRQLPGRTGPDHAPLFEKKCAIGHGGHLTDLVCRHQYGRAARLQLANDLVDEHKASRIELAVWLIEEHDLGLLQEDPR